MNESYLISMSHVESSRCLRPSASRCSPVNKCTHSSRIFNMTNSHVTWLIHIWHDSFICVCIWRCKVTETICVLLFTGVRDFTSSCTCTYEWVVSYMNESCHILMSHAESLRWLGALVSYCWPVCVHSFVHSYTYIYTHTHSLSLSFSLSLSQHKYSQAHTRTHYTRLECRPRRVLSFFLSPLCPANAPLMTEANWQKIHTTCMSFYANSTPSIGFICRKWYTWNGRRVFVIIRQCVQECDFFLGCLCVRCLTTWFEW